MADAVRILLLADSHIGFDLPLRPRVGRRRRGHDFLANYAAALTPALAGEVDLVVHGGDVFDRPAVDATAAYQAFDPLRLIAERGIPVFIVPGNHERSRLPHLRFVVHPNVHVFDRPRTFVVEVRGVRLAFTGFPYARRNVRTSFPTLLERAEWDREPADCRVLCLHHCVEGATVGPGNFVFTTGPDVIRSADVPVEFAAVLSGHIHRHQALTTDLANRRLDTPVLYPGSIERTSAAEIGETKGFMVVHVVADGRDAGVHWEFRPLPARPMIRTELVAAGMNASALESAIRAIVADAPVNAVLSVHVAGPLTDEQWRSLSAGHLRTFVPTTMNIEIRTAGRPMAAGPSTTTRARVSSSPQQLVFSQAV